MCVLIVVSFMIYDCFLFCAGVDLDHISAEAEKMFETSM